MRITRKRGVSAAWSGLLLLGVVGWLALRTLGSEAPQAVSPPRSEVPAVRRGVDMSSPRTAPLRDPEVAEHMRQRREERRLERREKSEVPFTLNPPGEQAGVAAFPPAGTKPIKRGIVVPDDFELPEGYVRHYQTTDDGRALPPILMFHPDVAGVDENGNSLLDPEDRIVPPDLAPPGLRSRMLDETTDVEERVGRRVHSDSAPPSRRR